MMVPAGALGYRISTDHHLQVITAASFGDIPAKSLGPGSVVFAPATIGSQLLAPNQPRTRSHSEISEDDLHAFAIASAAQKRRKKDGHAEERELSRDDNNDESRLPDQFASLDQSPPQDKPVSAYNCSPGHSSTRQIGSTDQPSLSPLIELSDALALPNWLQESEQLEQ
ncbi:hypothetical protein FOBRF1_013733 [Fusarium oxysporum]